MSLFCSIIIITRKTNNFAYGISKNRDYTAQIFPARNKQLTINIRETRSGLIRADLREYINRKEQESEII
ncbi:hypothetical protein H1P_6460005 [Hyella patelloides LEGE 07179]|uniref:Uncharacterized protein n=1 Tax=Hyella patelloides LEGE 07179 TaxID=945734 RepID=A0A563W279_9CYAN|nr:hypothetical protein H1P_6460005 [Hyella patelloides LEGE 07179]